MKEIPLSNKFINLIKTLRPWQILWGCVLISEVFTLLANTVQSLMWWGKISSDLLLIGTIDALVVSFLVASLLSGILRMVLKLEVEKDFLEKDLSGLRQAEESLRRTQERLDLSHHVGRMGYFEWNIKENRNLWSDHLVALYGFPPGGFDGTSKAWTERIHPEDRQGVLKTVRHSLKTGEYSQEYRIIHSDGSLHWIEARAKVFYNNQGHAERMVGVNLDITNRKKAEEALRLSEEKISKAFRASPDWITINTLKEDRYIDANNSFLRMSGFSREEVVGRTSKELNLWVNPDDRHKIFQLLQQNGSISNFETQFRLKSGSLLTMVWSAEIIELGGEQCLISVSRDVTEQRKNEEEVHRNSEFQNIVNQLLRLSLAESSLERILEKALDLILTVTWLIPESKGAILLVEEEPEILQMKVQRGLPAILGKLCDQVPFGKCICGRAAQKGEIEFSNRIDDRHEICYEGIEPHGHYCIPILLGKKVLGVLNVYLEEGHLRDEKEEEFLTVIAQTLAGIIIRKQTEEALKEREERFHTLFNQAADCILIMDPAGPDGPVIVEANQASYTMHGYDEGELIGKPISYLDAPESKKEIMERAAFIMSGKHLTGEAEHVRKDGSIFPVEISARLIQINGKPYIQAIDRDITERRKAQEEKKKLELQLLQSQKMEAIGTLAGGVAHDFNNLLTSIIGFSNLLQLDMEEDDPCRLHVEQILNASEKAARLTQSLLAFSRKQVMELKLQPLNSIIRGMEKILRRLLTEDIEFQVIPVDPDITIMADLTQIDQVLMNLASNARDAMPTGGNLVIEVKAIRIDQEFIQKQAFGRLGDFALISVRDTGCGMDESVKEKIFDPFFTTKEVGKGTGLGLSIVYGIIKQHDGFIQVESLLNQGTVIHIYLPAVKVSAVQSESISFDIKGGTETVLVAEDNQEVRDLIKQILNRKGYTVIEAGDGEQAVRRFLERQKDIDLLLLDVVMPQKNGQEVYQEISRLKPEIKVLFVSGYTGDVVLAKGVHHDRVDFIPKPIKAQELLLMVRDILDR